MSQSLQVVFLGTGAAAPSAARGASGVLVEFGRSGILMDCGEGTARALLGLSGVEIDAVCLSHSHPDHILGLPGLCRQMALDGRRRPLDVFALEPVIERAKALLEASGIRYGAFGIQWSSVAPDSTWQVKRLSVSSFETSHGCPSSGFRVTSPSPRRNVDLAAAAALGLAPGPLLGLLQRGESVTLPSGQLVGPDDVLLSPTAPTTVVYSGDTLPSPSVVAGAKGANVLIYEATYLDEHATLGVERNHSTARQAGEIAAAAGVGALVMTHVSSRYSPHDESRFIAEASAAFSGPVMLAEDFLRVDVRTISRPMPAQTLRKPVVQR